MNSSDLRQKFISYFKKRDHRVIPSASLVPENDPTVLFTTAGMHPLVPYLMGGKHPEGKRLANFQKCIRTGDIDEVGDAYHLTFFEMMGYWSLGSYWKSEAIEASFEFFTKELGIELKNFAVTCFEGEAANDIPKDMESFEIWRGLGIAEERIAFLPREDNWWGPAGETGPCGPDTEMFVWTGDKDAPSEFDPNDKMWMEIGNDVFMQYEKVRIQSAEDGGTEYRIQDLAQRNVDFGAGFERITAYLEGKSNVYETELFTPILNEIERISGRKYDDFQTEFRIIADHIKAAVFVLNDGIIPSNKDRGYVLRRLIRRAVVKGHQIGIVDKFTTQIARKIFEIYDGVYFVGDTDGILAELDKEETKFSRTIKEGLKLLAEIEEVGGKELFDLYQSYGLPVEISVEEAKRIGLEINNETIEQYNNLLKEHQELSRTASAGMFKGGLADSGEETTKLHTAAHLMLAALRKVLGDQVYQKGSNITSERLRFDFSYPDKVTPEQIKEVEDIVNEKIEADLPVVMEEMSLDEAKATGATGVFESKYGEKVKVYTIESPQGGGAISREICGGPHVTHTGELGHFNIQKEESSSAGVRRIKAVIE